ncbi:MAG: hypothetical protein P4L53_05375 [Candidatus Obscuribacterales bacterium]|nr:hypothetical protein [Candidatus Obscuribacterales bacterium]
MTTFADELRQAATNEAAKAEISHFKKLLKVKAAEGFREFPLAEFYYSKHETLGTVVVDYDDETVTLEGPIKEICAALQAEGITLYFKQDLRYSNHPKGSGVVTIVNARW